VPNRTGLSARRWYPRSDVRSRLRGCDEAYAKIRPTGISPCPTLSTNYFLTRKLVHGKAIHPPRPDEPHLASHRHYVTVTSCCALGATFTVDVDVRGAVVGCADVADVGLAELVCAESGQECGQDYREISFSPISLMLRFAVLHDGCQQRFDCSAGRPRRGCRGRGLTPTGPSVRLGTR
jgi:hypothetical protein